MMATWSDAEWADIEAEDVRDETQDAEGWVLAIHALTDPPDKPSLITIQSVSETRLNGSTRAFAEALAIALEKARRSYVASFGNDDGVHFIASNGPDDDDDDDDDGEDE